MTGQKDLYKWISRARLLIVWAALSLCQAVVMINSCELTLSPRRRQPAGH